MEFGGENEVVNSGAVEIDRQVVEVAAHVRKRRIAQLRRHEAAAFDANLEAIGSPGHRTQGFVGAIQTLQHAGMLTLIKARGAQEEVQFTQGANGVHQNGFRRNGNRPRNRLRRDWECARGRLRLCARAALLLYHRCYCAKSQNYSLQLRPAYSASGVDRDLSKASEGRLTLPTMQARLLPPPGSVKLCVVMEMQS